MSRKELGLTSLVIGLAVGWKLFLLAFDVFPFNADEGVVALMARHILAGARPIFFYGQAYMGSLDAFLVSLAFGLFGQTVLVVRITQLILYVGTIITTIVIGRLAFDSWKAGWLAGLLLAIPPVNTTLYTTVSLGGYGEALLIGNMILMVGLILIKNLKRGHPTHWYQYLLLGGLMGLGLWANGLTLIYSAPVGLALVIVIFSHQRLAGFKPISSSSNLLLGFLMGSLPWWIYAVEKGLPTLVTELLGTAVAVETSPWLVMVGQHVLNFGLLGLTALFGLRPPWEVRWLVVPLIPFVIGFWSVVIHYFVKMRKGPEPSYVFLILMGICFCLVMGFLLTPFGVDPSGRYFLPLNIILALVAGNLLVRKVKTKWQIPLVVGMLIFQGWGTLDCAARTVPGITTQFDGSTVIDQRRTAELIQFLQNNEETKGYSTYWVAYPLAFLSQEEIIFAPRLPYHADLGYTGRDDRYPTYTKMVEEAGRAAYITAHQPELDDVLRGEFASRGIKWSEVRIGDFQVFYGLSMKILPTELPYSKNILSP